MSPTQTFHDHVRELRHRILWVVVVVAASSVLAFNLRAHLINLIQKPLGSPLYYNTPAGSFNFQLKISVLVSIFVALPIIVYQVLRFIEPALPGKINKKIIAKVIAMAFLLASAGLVFGYYFMVPLSLHFFAGYSTSQLKPLISADSYLSYLISNLIIFVLVFQIPLIILFINRIKPLGPKGLLHYQKHIIIGSFIVALVLPFTYSPISQFIVAIPIIVLYYLSVILVMVANRKRNRMANNISTQPVSRLDSAIATVSEPVSPIKSVNIKLKRPLSTDGIINRPMPKSVNKLASSKPPNRSNYKTGQGFLSVDGII